MKIVRFILVFLFIGVSFLYAQDQEKYTLEVVQYKQIDTTRLNLHVFKPTQTDGEPLPAIVFFFGGGWTHGTAKHFYEHSKHLASRGMVAICAEYRIKEKHGTTPFECVTDGKSVVRWIRLHAGELGIAPDMIAAGGGSAGGHVAACTAVIEGFDSPDEDLTVSSVPNALVLFNPVIDTSEKGYGREKCGENWEQISPAHHVRAGLPPTIIFHGQSDTAVPVENVERFSRLMHENGNTCELITFPDVGHGFFNYGKFENKYYIKTVEEMDQFLTKLGYLQ